MAEAAVQDSSKVGPDNDVIRFTFEKEGGKVEEINIEEFPVQDKKDLMNILEWFRSNHKENKLTLEELRSFKEMLRFIERTTLTTQTNEKRKFFRVLFGKSEPNWAAVFESNLKKVPFLEAASSARWNLNSDENSPATITSVRATSLELLDVSITNREDGNIFVPLLAKIAAEEDSKYKIKEIYEDFDLLGILVNDESRVESSEDFNIAETCQRIRSRNQDAAVKLLLAINLDRFDGKKLNPKTRNHVYEAFLFIVSHPGTFNDTFCNITKPLYSRFKFTQNQLDKLDELEGGVINVSSEEDYIDCTSNSNSPQYAWGIDSMDGYNNYGSEDYYY